MTDTDLIDDPSTLTRFVKQAAAELGLQHCAITDTDLGEHETHLLNWLAAGFHGEMDYMQRHGTRRSRPAELLPGTIRIISVRMDYYPPHSADAESVLGSPSLGYVSRYAMGRDYHKVLRNRLQKLAKRIQQHFGEFGYRAFVDSAPVLEKAIAQKAGLGWIGKHSNLLSTDAGSWFFLGELYTDLPLAVDAPLPKSHCGSCTACLQACPTEAIVAPFKVDARRCISYLTIELKGSIPVEFRSAMGNRIYGCDDCQLVCPFNKFSNDTQEDDFSVRNDLDSPQLISLFRWNEEDFKARMAGSPIHRIGHESWIRNIAVALGNAPGTQEIIAALRERQDDPSAVIREHVAWALEQHDAS
ncbi:tRNA epoxyqueuosine(34) reductase QueG [Granulosicoccus sp. 3-233]|uniref:tRNA epoxyqueuosine(34) reductase QueG n=1 Tax=Granulosicoccus sp. 3-233 TaxID=3417969 RepID=UPI003D34F687